jgi:hypothetical protein
MWTYGIKMKGSFLAIGSLGWPIAATRDFYPALAALVSPL